jgi:hypothetical protein
MKNVFINTENNEVMLTCSCNEITHGCVRIYLDDDNFPMVSFSSNPYPTNNFFKRIRNAWYELTGQVHKIWHECDMICTPDEFQHFLDTTYEVFYSNNALDFDNELMANLQELQAQLKKEK